MASHIDETGKAHITQWYRLAKASEVNWESRRRIDINRIRAVVLPAMLEFSESTIKEVTYQTGNEQEMRAIVGVSGGLDSVVTSYVLAESMQQSLDNGRIDSAKLAIINFEGLEDSPVEEVVMDLKKRYSDINIQDLRQNIHNALTNIRSNVDEIVRKIEEKGLTGFNGELITRTMCQILNEASVRTNYATVDTTNGTEFILGEFSVGLNYAIVLLSDLYKSTVFTLGEILKIPPSVLANSPRNSAFGHTTKPQLYFEDLPETISPSQIYEVLDVILYWLYERKKEPQEISERLGHSLEFIRNVQRRIKNQEPRQKPPVFCTQTKDIRYQNRTKMGDIDVATAIEKEMLGDCFRK